MVNYHTEPAGMCDVIHIRVKEVAATVVYSATRALERLYPGPIRSGVTSTR
jgi:hypothetical protein